MTRGAAEQRNAYKGTPARPWVRIRVVRPDGEAEAIDLVADTGSPCTVIIGTERLRRNRHRDGLGLSTNFGDLEGGLLRVVIPEVGFDRHVTSYGGDDVVAAVSESSPDFQGIVGLPLLRMLAYGGNRDHFWLRSLE